MLIKIVVLFLAFMAVLAMLGRLRLPGRSRLETRRCARCGRLRLGREPCRCGRA